LERKARLSHLALPEMLRLFFVSGLLSCRDGISALTVLCVILFCVPMVPLDANILVLGV
jgi:hypothetical protein